MKKIKLKINNEEDRRELVSILTESGYKVKVVKEDKYITGDSHYVIIYLKE